MRRKIYLFKPVQMSVSTVFLLLLIYTVGIVWAKYLPRAEWVEGTRFAHLAPILHFVNPGEFRLKEARYSGSSFSHSSLTSIVK